jgi:membrane-bound metal-dependent hydrolase YbcI (DUF457 family)
VMGSSHLVHGVTSGSWLATAAAVAGLPPSLAVLGVAVAAYGALLPDLDHPRSMATWSAPPVTVALSWLLCLAVEHRGPTHRVEAAPVAAALVAFPAALLPDPLGGFTALWWWAALTVGWLTHVWGDARTLSGVPWSGRPRRVHVFGWQVAATWHGRLRVGRAFRTGSRREQRLARRVYRPAAGVSLALLLLVLSATGEAVATVAP